MKKNDKTKRQDNQPLTDEQLLQQYSQGHTEAFEELIRRYWRELYHFLYRFLGDKMLVEDVFQETFLQLHLSAGQFDYSKRLKPWLFTIAANKAKDALRRKARQKASELDAEIASHEEEAVRFVDIMPSDLPPPDETIENQEISSIVQTIVQQMPENLREVLILSYFHDFAYKDIAEILGVPLGTVKSRLHAAVKDFARRWWSAYRKRRNG